MANEKNGRVALTGGSLAAVLASACCVGPLVLVSVGIGGAWMSDLRVLQAYQPIFIAAAVGALFLAYRRIFRSAADCKPGEACAVPASKVPYKIIFWAAAVLVLIAAVFPYLAPFFY